MSSTPQVDVKADTREGKIKSSVSSGRWLAALGLILGALLLDFLYCKHMVAGLVNPDAMDFAQCARNLLQGHGFVTQIIHPLALTNGSNPLHQPDMTHGVLFPFVLALGFGMFGAKDAVVLGISGLFYALTAPLIYMLGRRLFDAKVGWIAALIFLTNGTILDYASSGTDITLFLFLATCLFYALYSMGVNPRQHIPSIDGKEEASVLPRASYLLAGTLMGLLYLTDPLFLWIVPVLFVTVGRMHPRRPLTALVWFGLPLLALSVPAMVRLGILTGNPFFGLRGSEVWMGTELSPGLLGYRLSPERFLAERATATAVLRKLCLALVEIISLLPRMPGSWILLFVAPSLVYQYSNPSATRLRSTLLMCLLALVIGGLFFSPFPIRLMIVFPVLLIFAVAFLLHMLEGARLKAEKVWAVSLCLGMVLLAPLVGDLVKTRYAVGLPEAVVAKALTTQMPEGDLCFSDQPWLVAWYGGRASIWMPHDDLTLIDLRKQFPRARWLFLTRQSSSLSSEWDETYRGLLSWNQQYRTAQETNREVPGVVRISGSQIPLLKALEGFTTVPPTGTGVPTVVVATVPETSQKAASP